MPLAPPLAMSGPGGRMRPTSWRRDPLAADRPTALRRGDPRRLPRAADRGGGAGPRATGRHPSRRDGPAGVPRDLFPRRFQFRPASRSPRHRGCGGECRLLGAMVPTPVPGAADRRARARPRQLRRARRRMRPSAGRHAAAGGAVGHGWGGGDRTAAQRRAPARILGHAHRGARGRAGREGRDHGARPVAAHRPAPRGPRGDRPVRDAHRGRREEGVRTARPLLAGRGGRAGGRVPRPLPPGQLRRGRGGARAARVPGAARGREHLVHPRLRPAPHATAGRRVGSFTGRCTSAAKAAPRIATAHIRS